MDRKLPGDQMGAFHAADLWYVFKTFLRGWRPWTGADYELAAACNTYWANFAHSGDPNDGRLPRWSPYTAANPASMYLTSVKQETLDEFVNLNIRLVGFANNHTTDYGWQGALETMMHTKASQMRVERTVQVFCPARESF